MTLPNQPNSTSSPPPWTSTATSTWRPSPQITNLSFMRHMGYPASTTYLNYPPPPLPKPSTTLNPVQIPTISVGSGVQVPVPSFFNNPASVYQHVESDKQRQAREWRMKWSDANPKNRATAESTSVQLITQASQLRDVEHVELNVGDTAGPTGEDEITKNTVTGVDESDEPDQMNKFESLTSEIATLRSGLDTERAQRCKAQYDLANLVAKMSGHEAEAKLAILDGELRAEKKKREGLEAELTALSASFKLNEAELNRIRLELDASRTENATLRTRIEASDSRGASDHINEKAISELKTLHESYAAQSAAIFDSILTVGPNSTDVIENEMTAGDAIDGFAGDPDSYALVIGEATPKKKRGRPSKSTTGAAAAGGISSGGVVGKRQRKQ